MGSVPGYLKLAKWPAGSTSLAFASGWRYFGKRDAGLPVIPTKAFVVAESGLVKTCGVQGWEGVVVHAGSKARCVVWSSGLCWLSPTWGDHVGCVWIGGPDVLPVVSTKLWALWPPNIFWKLGAPSLSTNTGHFSTIREGQLFSFVLTHAVKISHPAVVMPLLWACLSAGKMNCAQASTFPSLGLRICICEISGWGLRHYLWLWH